MKKRPEPKGKGVPLGKLFEYGNARSLLLTHHVGWESLDPHEKDRLAQLVISSSREHSSEAVEAELKRGTHPDKLADNLRSRKR